MAEDDLESPDESTFILVSTHRGGRSETLVPERLHRATPPQRADLTRPAEPTAGAARTGALLEETEIGAQPPLNDGSADATFAPVDGDSPWAPVGTRSELFQPATTDGETPAALCAASELEAAFFSGSVRAGRGTRRYSLHAVEGEGGMGRVLRVLDLDLGRSTAMKTLLPAWRCRVDLLASFATEARITGFLEHPNVIPVHEIGLAGEAGLYYTMKRVAGESLNAVLKRLHDNDPDTIARFTTFALLGVFRKVCDAVAYAHSNRLLHLDIKPHNVLLGRFGEVFLIDWGLARVCGDPLDEPDPVKRAFLAELLAASRSRWKKEIAGTPAYMAPEQARGDAKALDERTDVFLLGATLYHILALSPPYSASSPALALTLARRGQVAPPQLRNPARQFPAEVARIVGKAMAVRKQERYASVAELAADVDAVMSGRWQPETRKHFAAGELLMRQGDPAEESYVILSGRVEVSTGSGEQRGFLRECRAGEIIGEMALVSREPRSATVRAVEDTVVAVVTKEQLSRQLDNLPPYMAGMVSMLVARLRDLSSGRRSDAKLAETGDRSSEDRRARGRADPATRQARRRSRS